ncbi:MAG TPA: hypothetical protein VGP33_12730, partial [Chloroflexota bacterium]|nr:hypothetical protein [Chloroflexota bacterium]
MSNPYPGLRPFRAEEATFFFGREALAEAIATRLHLAPLTVLFARSGVGKSSFLTCRLIPLLQETSRVTFHNEWGAEAPELVIRRCLAAPSEEETTDRPVLILDQFEDVFKVTSDRDALWDEIAGAINVAVPPVSILICMREEWLGAWEEASDFLPDALASLERLAPLTEGELRRAICRPAELEGSVRVGNNLAPVLLRDLRLPNAYGLGGASVEPGLLQLVCRRLWEEATRTPTKVMDAALYAHLGGAERILREFVWRDLARVGESGAAFSPVERMIWVGLTRFLAIRPGVKVAVTPMALARRLHMRDLGVTGRAVLAAGGSRRSRKYLTAQPERRGDPPGEVAALITRTLEKGVALGFLKRQGPLPPSSALPPGDASANGTYELAHDALSPLLEQFALQFEDWMRRRTTVLLTALAGGVAVILAFAVLWLNVGPVRGMIFLLLVITVFSTIGRLLVAVAYAV